MAIKKLVIITLLDNKEWMLENAEKFNVTIHRYYETVGKTEMGDYEAIAFVVSGQGVGDFIDTLNDVDEFGC